MPEPGCSARWSASQASRCSGVGSRTTPRRSDSRSSEPRSTSTSLEPVRPVAELLGDVGADPGVGGGGGRQHRDAVGQVGEQGADPAVVGPEVVAPVGDAVRLVDDQQPAGRGQPRQHLVAEAGVVEPLRADQQHVDLAGVDRGLDRLPLLDVGGVDRDGADAGPLGGRDLVAHQRQQRRDDHGRARRPGRAAAAWPRSRPPTCPSPVRCTTSARRRSTTSASIAAHWSSRSTASVAADQRAQMPLGVGAHVGRGGGHVSCLAAGRRPGGRASTGRRGLRPGTPRAARSRTAHTAGVRRAGPRVAADSRSATGPTTRRPRTAPTYRR